MNNKLLWWGYEHIEGTIHAKRFFSYDDIDDANESSFCKKIILPFIANNREEAIKIIKSKL